MSMGCQWKRPPLTTLTKQGNTAFYNASLLIMLFCINYLFFIFNNHYLQFFVFPVFGSISSISCLVFSLSLTCFPTAFFILFFISISLFFLACCKLFNFWISSLFKVLPFLRIILLGNFPLFSSNQKAKNKPIKSTYILWNDIHFFVLSKLTCCNTFKWFDENALWSGCRSYLQLFFLNNWYKYQSIY